MPFPAKAATISATFALGFSVNASRIAWLLLTPPFFFLGMVILDDELGAGRFLLYRHVLAGQRARPAFRPGKLSSPPARQPLDRRPAASDNEAMAMTEQEWLACSDPTPMLAYLKGRATERKFRLLVAAFW